MVSFIASESRLEPKLRGRVSMYAIVFFLFAVLLSACATGAGDPRTGGTEQVAATTAAWRAAYDSRDPARITAMYDSDAVL
jgi:hypothetical protein